VPVQAATVRSTARSANIRGVSAVTLEHVSHVDAASPELRRQLLDTWVAVTDAGGAVGFVPPANPAEIAPALDGALARVIDGHDELVVLRRDGAAVGMAFVVAHTSALRRHWRTVLRVMVHPSLQGQGAGAQLLEGVQSVASELGLEQLHLTVRGGTGVEGFYERFGFVVVGRHPGAIRVAPGDDRDELILVKRL
jgi:GNAT superfamily N-acetyltransferase